MKKLSPHPIKFQGLNPGETIELFLRRHPIVLWKKLIAMLFVGAIPIIVWIVLLTQTTFLADDASVTFIGIVFVGSVFYLFWARLVFTVWLDFYLDVWVVTNERIMNIEQKGMFNRKISEQMLSRVQDVTTHTVGFLATTLRYGDIFVQTAGETVHFVFRDIAHPEIVAQEITKLQKQAIQRESSMHQGAVVPTSPQSAAPVMPPKVF